VGRAKPLPSSPSIMDAAAVVCINSLRVIMFLLRDGQ
jgi:hypothetical protein